MKLSYKLRILIIGISLLPLLATGVFAALTTQKAFENQVRSQIEATATRQSMSIDSLIEQSSAQLSIIANRLQLRLLIDKYNTDGGSANRELITTTLNKTIKSESSFQDILIVNPRGIVISASDTSYIGDSYATNEAFTGGKNGGVSDLIAIKNGTPIKVISAPLFIKDKFIGVVIGEVPIELFSVITREYADLGRTGESYIAKKEQNGKYIYVTHLRFKDEAIFEKLQFDPNTNLDYRNKEVLKVRRELMNGWLLVTKIDTDEVNAPANKLRNILAISTGVTLLTAAVIGIIVARRITRPIEEFTVTVTEITKGDYSKRANSKYNDEIGILGAAFNQMTDSMLSSQKRLESSIASLSQGFIIIDNNGKIKLINESTRALLQLSESVINKKLSVALGDIKGLDIEDALEQCLRGEYVNLAELKLEDNSLKIFFAPVLVGSKVDGAVILIIDETEERMLQRTRDEFFSIASHELRTPLTAIRGNASLMKQFFPLIDKDKDLKEIVSDIYDSSVRLISIVNDFLDVSRLEQNKISFVIEPLKVADVTQAVIKDMTTVAAEKNTVLNIESNLLSAPLVLGDANRVKQVIYNLVGNALKFTEDGVITMSSTIEGKNLIICVTDTGSGMNLESQKLLFRKFQQATDNIFTRDSSRGTGLGLYISKILVEKMNGQILLQSSVKGKGSVFSFSLPLADSDVK